MLLQAEELLRQLATEQELVNSLTEALEARDLARVKQLAVDAQELKASNKINLAFVFGWDTSTLWHFFAMDGLRRNSW